MSGNGKWHAVVKNDDGKFLGARGRWVSEYPDAICVTEPEAKKLLRGAGPGTSAIAHYGDDNEALIGRNPATPEIVIEFSKFATALRHDGPDDAAEQAEAFDVRAAAQDIELKDAVGAVVTWRFVGERKWSIYRPAPLGPAVPVLAGKTWNVLHTQHLDIQRGNAQVAIFGPGSWRSVHVGAKGSITVLETNGAVHQWVRGATATFIQVTP